MLDKLEHLDQVITLFLNGSHSLFLDGLAVSATATVTWLPVAILLLYVIIKNNEMPGILLSVLGVALCILIADQVASSWFKPMVARFRPTNDPSLMYLVDVVNDYRGGRYGFFSSHAANTFSVATFVSLLVRHRGLTLTLVSWALLNCWTRVYLGVHYFGDLLVGTLCGVLVGFLVYFLYKRLAQKPLPSGYVSGRIYTSSGYVVADARLLMAGMLLTYLGLCYAAWFCY